MYIVSTVYSIAKHNTMTKCKENRNNVCDILKLKAYELMTTVNGYKKSQIEYLFYEHCFCDSVE